MKLFLNHEIVIAMSYRAIKCDLKRITKSRPSIELLLSVVSS